MTNQRRHNLLWLVEVLCLSLVVSCGGGSGSGDCDDGVDNDGDGFFDREDPACKAGLDHESLDSELLECDDLIDNDNDGLVDTDDTGCEDLDDDSEYNEPLAACKDGLDNDSDGLIDYPNDPGCENTLDDIEEDSCPSGQACPACANGVDDDDDGIADYPDDPGCNGAADTDEYNPIQTACGSVVVKALPENRTVEGDLAAGGTNGLISADCGGTGREIAYTFDVTVPVSLVISTDYPETDLDTVIYLRSDCKMAQTELGCSDDLGASLASKFTVPRVDPGSYYLIIDAHDNGSSGHYKLTIEQFIAEGEPCDPEASECAPGLFCRLLTSDVTEETCEQPSCNDGLDNDEDTLIDYPNEPGCDSPSDNDEIDTCPGEGCPACSDDDDNDEDTLIDYPQDTGCSSASDPLEFDCEDAAPIATIVSATTLGNTTGAGDDFSPACASDDNAPDRAYLLNVPVELTTLTIDTENSDLYNILSVRSANCAEAELACNDDSYFGNSSIVTLSNVEAGHYHVIVDGYYGYAGAFELHVKGLIALGGTCNSAQTELFSCQPGSTCMPAGGGAETCQPTACNDGLDNDDDDFIDYPYEPGCVSVDDLDEADTCPGAGCPECSDGEDNDGDTLVDYPDDFGCPSAGAAVELNCEDTVAVQQIVAGTTTGNTTGGGNDYTPSCSSYSSAVDRVFWLSIPGTLTSLEIDTEDSTFDTVLSIKGAECTAADVDCDDDGAPGFDNTSLISLTSVAAGTYHIIVDGYSSSQGAFELHVNGTIASGQACNQAQITAGIFTCQTGTTCTNSVCAP